ncbi:MAG TPA: tetratricopeptide repeat protein [Candidatus Acidoferrum sp.]|nr:tetratricopeptide repeat protein [Candidatus Acidoferrum sp.]
MKTLLVSCLLFGALLCSSTAVSARSVNWWVTTDRDAQWTNRPLNEVSTEAKGTNAWAKFFLARACFHGTGRSRDVQEAFTWLQQASEQGLPDAQFMLSRFYLSATGTAADRDSGVKWAEQAATVGHADALAILGDAYGSGTGAPQDAGKAHEYFRRAIDGGSVWGLDWFGHFLMNGEGRTVAKTNYVLALQCFERAASNGLTHSSSHLVEFYRNGLGTPPDEERVVFWARHAADQNDFEMMEKLAAIYDEGIGEPRHESDTSLELLRRVASSRASNFEIHGSRNRTRRDLYALSTTATEMCRRYRFGLGTSRDYISFAQWLFVLKRTGDWDAEMPGARRKPGEAQPPHIFIRILEGKMPAAAIEDRLIREAVTDVNQALQLGDANACRKIGEMYRNGSALTPDSPMMAWLWLNRAAEFKDANAAISLLEIEGSLSAEQLRKLRAHYLPRPRQ